jgi:hypothetical protein
MVGPATLRRGTDGTFPLFKENVQRESAPFFEGHLLMSCPLAPRTGSYDTKIS